MMQISENEVDVSFSEWKQGRGGGNVSLVSWKNVKSSSSSIYTL